MKKTATQIDWGKISTMHDPNAATDTLIKNIQICIKNSYETKKKKHNNNRLPRKDWITKGIIISCNKKDDLLILSKNNPGNQKLKKEFTDYNKILNQVIEKAKMMHDRKKYKNIWMIQKNFGEQ